ncbi:histidine kinase [Arenibacter sp. GZD96]|uniref:hypothetical protein n=1 Tax=Aurantibrevibacter litoralis TaxID=3106030 RepID=UPI002AFE03D0|nr:hypothetical protein [Arenibacter sp. GZD-96]MEA1787360.1 histidine kinase [Arenibacter sp. GZD-96]
MKLVKILAVDDHEMTMIGYKYILEEAKFDGFMVRMDTANSLKLGLKKIEHSINNLRYDIILLDVNLSNNEEGDFRNGEDLGVIARQLVPDSKIVYLSSFSDNYRINSILSRVNPDGYMVKSEVDEMTLVTMVKTILVSPPYYTQKALSAIRKKMANDVLLDENDKKILYNLSIGSRTKDMLGVVSLSLAGIENRKRQLKVLFGVEKQSDQALIHEAKNRGFL